MPRAACLPALAALALTAACAHHAPAAASAPAPAAGARDTASDVEQELVGDWTWNGDLNQQAVNGTWSLNHANGRWTGTLVMGSYPAAPIQSMSVSGADINFAASVMNQDYRFRCHMETRQTVTCFISTLNGSGRITAYKR